MDLNVELHMVSQPTAADLSSPSLRRAHSSGGSTGGAGAASTGVGGGSGAPYVSRSMRHGEPMRRYGAVVGYKAPSGGMANHSGQLLRMAQSPSGNKRRVYVHAATPPSPTISRARAAAAVGERAGAAPAAEEETDSDPSPHRAARRPSVQEVQPQAQKYDKYEGDASIRVTRHRSRPSTNQQLRRAIQQASRIRRDGTRRKRDSKDHRGAKGGRAGAGRAGAGNGAAESETAALLQAVQSASQPLRAKASQASLVPAAKGADTGAEPSPAAKPALANARFKAAARVVGLLSGGKRSPFRGGPGSLSGSASAEQGQESPAESEGGVGGDGGAQRATAEEEEGKGEKSTSAAAAAFRKRALERRASMMVQSSHKKRPSPEAAVAAERAQTEAAEAAKREEERLRKREEEEKRKHEHEVFRMAKLYGLSPSSRTVRRRAKRAMSRSSPSRRVDPESLGAHRRSEQERELRWRLQAIDPRNVAASPPRGPAAGSSEGSTRWSLTQPTAIHRARSLARGDLLSRARTQIGRDRFNRVLQRELEREEAEKARAEEARRRAEEEARRRAAEGEEEGEEEEEEEEEGGSTLRVHAGGTGGREGGPSSSEHMRLPAMSPMRRWEQQPPQSPSHSQSPPQSPPQPPQYQQRHREPYPGLGLAEAAAAAATTSLPDLHAAGGAASSYWSSPSGGRASSPSGRRRASRRQRGASRRQLPSVQRPYDLVFCHGVTALCSVEPEIT